MRTRWSVSIVLNLLIGVGMLSGAVPEGANHVANESRGPSGLSWQVDVPFERIALVVEGPNGEVFRGEFQENPSYGLFDSDGNLLSDGTYTYLLTVIPRIEPSVRKRLEELRESGDREALESLMMRLGIAADNGLRQAGRFEVIAGSVVPDVKAERSADVQGGESAFGAGNLTTPLVFDITGNWTLTGDLGIGTDVPSQEIDIVDTEPSIQLSDSDEVSLGWFIIGDQAGFDVRRDFASPTTHRVFFIDAAAPKPSLWVDAGGDLGVRTSTPVLDFHAVTGDTPGLRLEQDGSGGFTPQTWDVEGNELGFFINDVTNALVPLRIDPGAPSNSIRVNTLGDVGFGTSAPAAPVHIQRNVGEPNIRLQTLASAGVRFELVNMGGEWEFIHGPGGNFNFNRVGVAGNQFVFTTSGNLVIQGVLTQGSSREAKMDFHEFESQEVLQRVVQLPLSSWRYKTGGARHFGPMAEDFKAAFDLGPDEKQLAPGDVAGVALAAIQGLNDRLTELSATVNAKNERIEALEKELAELKASLSNQSSTQK
ncbi:MAG TPA: tail fiber domain-containing protein [Vicinamibacteria bacterium]|nr:tail fiber domain-containing protein [Vicinamibacteria bacterium]